MKDLYYQIVNFIQSIKPIWFGIAWFLLFACIFVCVVKFFKIYNGTQKKFEKLSLLVIAILLFALLVFLTYIRN